MCKEVSSSLLTKKTAGIADSDSLDWLENCTMTRRWVLSLLFLVAASCLDAGSTKADVISQDNSFCSYNISGVNYGSMQWERSHNRKSSSRNGNNGLFFRRR
jgi:hypothetical protein